MGIITANPDISLQANIGSPLIYYFADGAALFGCIGSPEGVIAANKRSIAVSDNGSVYIKTTDLVNTGWTVVGGGGSGTVTSIALAGNAIFDFSASSANPITSSGTFNVDFATQTANKVFAGPSSGGAAKPTFRALVASDLSLAAPPPAGGVPFNDGTNAFTAVNGFKFDSASNTLQVGESTVLKGTVQLFAALSAGSVKHTVNNPASNYVWIWGDSLPTTNDLLKVTVSGNNVTVASIAASALGFPTINATDGVIPYRSSATAFSDSPLTRTSSSIVTNSGSFTATRFLSSGSGTESSPFVAGNVGRGFYEGIGGLVYTDGTARFLLAPTSIMATQGAQIGWNTSGSVQTNQTMVTGFAAMANAIIRATNGSTGAAKFVVGSSTASTTNQFLVDSQSTSVIAGFFSMPNGSSVPTIQGVTNSIQSFAFNPSGKLVGGCNIPTTNQQFSAMGNAKSDVSTIGNVGTGVDNLLSFTLQGNVLNNTGDYVEFDAFGEFENNANNKEVKIVYGATTIFATGALPFGTAALANWRINAKILRTAASGQKCIVTFWSNDATTKFLQQITTSGEDMTANKTIQFTGEATSNNDITQLHLESKLTVALTS